VRTISEGQQIKARAQEEVQAAKEEAEVAIKASRQTATLETHRLLFAAQASEKLWRKHADRMTNLSASTEKRINILQDLYQKGLEALGKRLEGLQAKLEKAQTDGDDAAVKKLGGDVSKARNEVKKAEIKRVELLEHDYSILQARSLELRAEKEKLEMKLIEARTNGFTPDTQRFEDLRVEVERLRVEYDAQKEKFVQLDKLHAELEASHAVLEATHSELQGKYVKVKSTLDKAVGLARASRSRGASKAGEIAGENGVSTVVEHGKRRASSQEDEMMGGDVKRAKMAEAPKEVETATELTSNQKVMVLVQKRMEIESSPKNQG
jgi:hypothetical protein